ncbi:hypothetical protein Thit_2184 [Thermoanaerobacter italicus Ab9]|uniref:Uncharacterized protein n=2 Tax=Thermoanaerobacter TaxID=1754 RepID=D3T5M5_THEIA|nr:hypothetical protein Thit_2184 [Thermoanaerobacter italicus Ab9]MDP9751935.1 hypothetical protein [Thermoanaerobacter pentosaceus]
MKKRVIFLLALVAFLASAMILLQNFHYPKNLVEKK